MIKMNKHNRNENECKDNQPPVDVFRIIEEALFPNEYLTDNKVIVRPRTLSDQNILLLDNSGYEAALNAFIGLTILYFWKNELTNHLTPDQIQNLEKQFGYLITQDENNINVLNITCLIQLQKLLPNLENLFTDFVSGYSLVLKQLMIEINSKRIDSSNRTNPKKTSVIFPNIGYFSNN
jgi:hypothetical protein